MLHSLPLIFSASLIVAAAIPAPQASPPSPKLQLITLKTNGDGCPNNTTTLSATISPNDTKIILTYSPPLALYFGPNILPSERSKSCIALLTLRHSSTERFSLSSTTYRGSAALDTGLTASLKTLYSDVGTGSLANSSVAISGPLMGMYTHEVNADGVGGRAWTSWPRREETVLRVDTTVVLTATRASAMGSVWGEAPFTLENHLIEVEWLEG